MINFKKIKKLGMLLRLKTGLYRLVFTKRDGSTRIMLASLRGVPVTSGGRSNVHGSPDHIVVYDVENQGWKTIIIDTIQEFSRV